MTATREAFDYNSLSDGDSVRWDAAQGQFVGLDLSVFATIASVANAINTEAQARAAGDAARLTPSQGDDRYSQLGHGHSSISNGDGSVSVDGAGQATVQGRLDIVPGSNATIRASGGAGGQNPAVQVISTPSSSTTGTAVALIAGLGGSAVVVSDNQPFFFVKDSKTSFVNDALGNGTVLGALTPTGQLGVNQTSPGAQLHVVNIDAAQPVGIDQAASGQTAPLRKFQLITTPGGVPTVRDAAALDVLWTDSTDATRTSVVAISTVTGAGPMAEAVRFGGARPLDVQVNASGRGLRQLDASGNSIDWLLGGALTRMSLSGNRAFYINSAGLDSISIDANGTAQVGSAGHGGVLPLRVIVNGGGVGFRVGDETDTNYLQFTSGGVLSRFETTGNRPLFFRVNGNEVLNLGATNEIGFLGASPVARQAVSAAATDAASALLLTNQIRAALISFGLLQ